MFDELRPDEVPTPPANALGEAMRRGTSIRRRRRTAWAGGVAAAVVLGVAVLLGGPFTSNGNDSVTVVPATATPAPRDYSPIPEQPSEERDGVQFGYLEEVGTAEGGTLLLRIQPGFFYRGQEAADHNGGEWPPNDYVDGKDPNTSPTELRLDPRAALRGQYALLGGEDEEGGIKDPAPITAAELVANFDQRVGGDVMVWYRQAEDGSITSLSEQYVP